MFEKFPRLTRFSHGWTITEKLDGSNGQILIIPVDQVTDDQFENALYYDLGDDNNMAVFAGSRNRILTVGKQGDHLGFAQFVQDRALDLIEKLGEGRHFGEWVGPGVQKRNYYLKEKRFVLFNTNRWGGVELPEGVDVVPILAEGYMDNPGSIAKAEMLRLEELGSAYAPGFMNPEGVVMHHSPSKTTFKKTFDYDEQGKWAENQEARQQ